MRYEGNKVVITESELRWLVNESAKNVLLTEVGNWAGIKNAWNGLANGKFNVKKSFQTAKQAQTFQKYYNNAQKSITGMQQVLNNSNQPDLASKLQQVNAQLQQAANGFQQRAAQASGRQQQPQQQASAPNTNINAGGNTGGNTNGLGNVNGPQGGNTNGPQQTARTIQMNPTATNQNGQHAEAAANANTPGLATKMGQGVGKAGAAMRNFAQGVKNGYNNNKVNLDNGQPQHAEAAAKVGTPQAETPQAEAPKVATPQGGNQQPNQANPMTYVPAEQQGERNPEETQGGYGFNKSPFAGEETQQAKQPQQPAQQNNKITWPDAGNDYQAPKPKMSMFNQSMNNVRNRQQKPTETDYARKMMNNNYGDEGFGNVNQPTYGGHGMQPDPKAVAQSKERDNDMNNAFNGLTRDYDMDYNSVRPRKVMPESKTVRITQDYIRNLVNETLNILMNEEGEAGGGGATNAAGVMQGGGTNPGAGQYDVPAFGGKSKKKVGGNAFSEPIMRQKHNLGDVTKAPANQVDMKPALDRTPGKIAMGERKK
jgi:hypothetical protein